jgi:hypothetical protein
LSSKRKQHKQDVNPLFWVSKITLPLLNQQSWYNSSSFFTPFFKRTHHWTWIFL